jgi:hypothetical protein
VSTLDIWGIDQVVCSQWRATGDTAAFSASNWAGDSCAGILVRTGFNQYVLTEFSIDIRTPDFWTSLPGFDVEKEVVPEIVTSLEKWNKSLDDLLSWVPKGSWPKGPSSDTDFNFAVVAFLYEDLLKFGGRSAIKILSVLMQVEESTAKERIRESRKRKFLTSPGKGVRGTSYSTSKARKILEKEGVINA